MANVELSEFFSLVSQEKNQNRTQLKKRIENPKSDLGSLFKELENAHKETKKVSEESVEEISEELVEEKILTEDDQNKLEVFSSLVDSLNTPIEPTVEPDPIIEPEEPVDDTEKITAFEELFKKFAEPTPQPEPEPIVEITPVPEVKEEKVPEIYSKAIADPVELLTGKTVERTGDIIQDIVSSLDDMGEKTEVKEEIDQIAALRGEFDKFKNVIQRHISNQDHSGAGSGEVRLEFLDDVQSSTAKVDGKFIKYSSSDSKWIGADVSVAADDVAAGDAAVTLTTTSGDITIDAAANDSDIIFKGTDGGVDTTFLTLDGSAAGEATFNAMVVATGVNVSTVTTTSGNMTIDAQANDSDIIFKGTDGGVDTTFLTLDGSAAGEATFNAMVVATGLDISGNVDVDGTLEADAITVDGTTLAEYISDTAGGMVSSNTETGITVTYQDADNTIDFAIDAAQTTITSIYATDLIMGEDSQTAIDFGTANEIDFKVDNAARLTLTSSALYPVTDNEIDLGTNSLEFKDAYFDGTVTADAFAGPLTGNVTGNASGTAATVTGAAQTNITSLGTLTALTVDDVVINGATIGHGDDTDLMTVADGVLTVAGELDAATLDISGNADIDGTLEADAYTVDGTTLAEYISDTVGAMVSSNTETGITVTYQDGDNTIDFVVGTLNQDTTGTASLVTVTDSTANTNFPVVFHNESNALLDDTGALRYNPSTGELLVPKLTVAGTTTTVDTVTMQAENAVIFEGATADAHETTLSIVDPTGDHTQYLINQGGYIPLLAAATTTTISSTPAELNLLDGSSANSVVNSKAVIYGSSGEVAGTLSTAAQSNITSLGTLTTLTVDNIIINGTNIGHTSDTDSIAIASDGVVTFSQAPVFPDGSIAVADLDIDGATDIGAAIVDADLFVIDDGAGGTNRKTTASRIATYVGASAGAFSIANLDIDGGTDINAALTASDLIIVDDGAGGTNRKAPLSRVTTLTDASATALAIALG